MRIRVPAFVLSMLGLLLCSGWTHAQTWPQQPIKLVVGLAAGGVTDTIARITAKALTERLGQTVFVENRPGAAGAIAAEAVARGPADGYTLMMGNLPQMVLLPAMSAVRYDPVQDFAPISIIGSNSLILVVNPSVPAKTLAQFLDYVRAQPGKLAYGVGGIGNVTHLTMALLLKRAGVEMITVPYQGGAPAMADLVAGHVQAIFANSSDALPQIHGGAVRALAISSRQRSPQLPDVPTVIESGFPEFTTSTWNGVMVPAHTPRAIVDRLATEIAGAVKDPAVIEQLHRQGVDPIGNTPEEFAAAIKSDVTLWSEAVDIAGVKDK